MLKFAALFGKGDDPHEPFFERAVRTFNFIQLGAIIAESFPHKELTKFMSSLGAVYPGIRIQSIDHVDLAQNFASDAFQDPQLFASLERALDRIYAEGMKKMSAMPVSEIKNFALPSRLEMLSKEKKIGSVVWIMLKDERSEVRALVPGFLKAVDQFMRALDRQHKEYDQFADRFDRDELSKKEVQMLKQMMSRFGKEQNEARRELAQKKAKLDSVLRDRDRLHKEIGRYRSEANALQSLVGKMNKEMKGKDSEIELLKTQSKRFTRREEEELKRQIRALEREHRKGAHDLVDLQKQAGLLGQKLDEKNIEVVSWRGKFEGALNELEGLKGKLAQREAERERNVLLNASQAGAVTHSAPNKGKRLGVFLDMQNIWIAAKRLQRKVDFGKLLELIVLDRHLVKAIAYVVVVPELDQEPFFEMLRRKGFEVRYRTLIRRADGSAKGNWDTGMVVEAIDLVDKRDLDIVHVVSGDGDFVDLLKHLKRKGVRIEASGFPFNSAQDLVRCVDNFFPLDEEIFQPLKELAASGV